MLSLKHLRFCLLAGFAAAAPVPAALASPATVAKQEIQAVLTRRNQARQHRDLNAYMATFTPDWVSMNVQEKSASYATLRKSTATEFAKAGALGAAPVRYTITGIAAHGQAAQVMVSARFNYPGRKTPTGSIYYCCRDVAAAQLWVKGPTGWRLRQERYLTDGIRFSAKPITN